MSIDASRILSKARYKVAADDDARYSRNGDYSQTRMQAQQAAANLVVNGKVGSLMQFVSKSCSYVLQRSINLLTMCK